MDVEEGGMCIMEWGAENKTGTLGTKRPWQSHGKEFRLYWKVFKSMNQGGNMI